MPVGERHTIKLMVKLFYPFGFVPTPRSRKSGLGAKAGDSYESH